jgi:hypothetical protein
VTARQDFIHAYTQVWDCSTQYADSLLRQVETEYADAENKLLQDRVDNEAAKVMLAQETAALREQVNEWKSWEASARGAAMQIASTLGHDEILPLLQAGEYDRATAALRKQAEPDG